MNHNVLIRHKLHPYLQSNFERAVGKIIRCIGNRGAHIQLTANLSHRIEALLWLSVFVVVLVCAKCVVETTSRLDGRD